MFLFVAIFLGDTSTEFLIWPNVFPSNLFHSRAETPELLGRISTSELDAQPWCFTNNSLGLPYAHFFSVCLFLRVCVVCVCFLLYMSFYLCSARYVCRVLFHLHNHQLEFRNIQIQDYCCTHKLVYDSISVQKINLKSLFIREYTDIIYSQSLPTCVYLY